MLGRKRRHERHGYNCADVGDYPVDSEGLCALVLELQRKLSSNECFDADLGYAEQEGGHEKEVVDFCQLGEDQEDECAAHKHYHPHLEHLPVSFIELRAHKLPAGHLAEPHHGEHLSDSFINVILRLVAQRGGSQYSNLPPVLPQHKPIQKEQGPLVQYARSDGEIIKIPRPLLHFGGGLILFFVQLPVQLLHHLPHQLAMRVLFLHVLRPDRAEQILLIQLQRLFRILGVLGQQK